VILTDLLLRRDRPAVAGFFALAAAPRSPPTFLTAYGAFWLGYTAIEVYVRRTS